MDERREQLLIELGEMIASDNLARGAFSHVVGLSTDFIEGFLIGFRGTGR